MAQKSFDFREELVAGTKYLVTAHIYYSRTVYDEDDYGYAGQFSPGRTEERYDEKFLCVIDNEHDTELLLKTVNTDRFRKVGWQFDRVKFTTSPIEHYRIK